MPNYVMNVVKFSPVIPDVEFRAFLSKVMVPAKFPDHEALPANSESDEAVSPLAPVPQDFRGMDFDFNALIPMPKDLDIVSGSETDTGLLLFRACAELPSFCCSYIAMAHNWNGLFHGSADEDIDAEYKTYAKIVHPDVNNGVPETVATGTMQLLNTFYNRAIAASPAERKPASVRTFCELFLESLSSSWEPARLVKKMRDAGCSLDSPGAFAEFVKTKEGAELYKLGEQAYSNQQKYGAPTWYEWCNENWGTKWNAGECSFDFNERKLTFTTAWAVPTPIIRALASQFPTIEFTWGYADEDTGCNTGFYNYEGSVLSEDIFDNCSPEAYQMYVDCWGPSECMYQDECGAWARYDCDDCPHPC